MLPFDSSNQSRGVLLALLEGTLGYKTVHRKVLFTPRLMVHHLSLERESVDICGPLVKWPKTPASHAGNTSSNLVRVTILKK